MTDRHGHGDSFVLNAKRNTYVTTLSNKLASLDMKDQINFELRNEDLRDLQELGAGSMESVKKVEHVPTKTIMAKKIVLIDAKPAIRKQILRELQILHDCRSPYIVSFFGAFIADPNICICMEFADKGSLDGVYKKIGPIEIEVVGKTAECVLEGLAYLYDVYRIIHRDIKPRNVLLFSTGKIKISDFGAAGELINSIADTFVGTTTYMSPERIQGAAYTVRADVWSLGISLIELATGRFPFSVSEDLSDNSLDDADNFSAMDEIQMEMTAEEKAVPENQRVKMQERERMKGEGVDMKEKRKSQGVSLQGGEMTMSILELLQHIVNEPAPRLSGGEGRMLPEEAVKFVDSCLLKDPDARLTPKELLTLPWMDMVRESTFDMEAWANSF